MSDLKHKTPGELRVALTECDNYINSLKSKLSGQEERRKWIEKYLYEKTPQELSYEEVERRLGHKLIIKGD